ncbi:MAG: hypothetical protein RBU21_11660, partial [FCB group bacterium]|nr:hypothetical protein [FCB group bacterium]
CGLLFAGIAVAEEASKPPLIINEDNSHFYMFRSADEMTVDGLNAFVDQYANTQVTHLFLNASAMRTSYDSAVWDAIWEVGNQAVPQDNELAKKWVENSRLLNERGLDPYAVWIARCREKKISPWISMRMNDVHDVDNPSNFMHSTFWLNHPEYRRAPETKGWFYQALNYGLPEVREHNMKLIRELLDRYDMDGLELDWMRFGYHFKPGEEEQGRAILTQFMRDVRQLTDEASKQRGHRVQLSARVPAHPDAALGLGMDGITWVQEGLVDLLVPTPFWATSDFDIPMELWRERIGADAAKKALLLPGLEVLVRASPGAAPTLIDLEATRGFAATAWHRGADGIYLFNFMDPAPTAGGPAAYRELLEKGLARDYVNGLARRHPVTYRDTVPAGVSADVVLPVETIEGGRFRIHTGPLPTQGSVVIIVGLAERDGVRDAEFDVTLNGQSGAALPDLADLSPYPGAKRAAQFNAPLPALLEGYNEVFVKQRGEVPGQQIVWAEIRLVP